MAGCALVHPKFPEPLVNPLCRSRVFGVCWDVGRRRRVGWSLRTCTTILDITSTAWATVLSLWPHGQWLGNLLPEHPSLELLARGLPRPLGSSGSCRSAPNSSGNPDRGINSTFVYKSVVLRRDEQLLCLT